MKMIGGFIGGFIIAWILTFFHVDSILITAIQPFVHGIVLNSADYYVAFGLIGLIGGLIETLRSRG
jgi:cell division protein FtsX